MLLLWSYANSISNSNRNLLVLVCKIQNKFLRHTIVLLVDLNNKIIKRAMLKRDYLKRVCNKFRIN